LHCNCEDLWIRLLDSEGCLHADVVHLLLGAYAYFVPRLQLLRDAASGCRAQRKRALVRATEVVKLMR
jgi:hypothetical protein